MDTGREYKEFVGTCPQVKFVSCFAVVNPLSDLKGITRRDGGAWRRKEVAKEWEDWSQFGSRKAMVARRELVSRVK